MMKSPLKTKLASATLFKYNFIVGNAPWVSFLGFGGGNWYKFLVQISSRLSKVMIRQLTFKKNSFYLKKRTVRG
jgi:hypothetical protein